MNESDSLRLLHMWQYGHEVVQFTQGRTRESLNEDLLLLRGLTMSIAVIGEAASRISADTRDAFPQFPWREIGNFLFHGYYRVDPEIVWATATQAVPELFVQLSDLFPNDLPLNL